MSDNQLIATLSNPKLWSVDSPELYKVYFKCGEDEVESYFGMREFSTMEIGGKRCFALNGKPIFHNGLLDQGYFHDGIYTPSSNRVYYDEIKAVKDMGFNMLRKHIKIEPMLWYYYCDILGVLVPMLAVYLLCMLSMLYITVYILDGMVYELSVYGLLGATNKKLILIPAAVQGALLTAANGIAVLLHVLLYKPLFSRINLYEFTYTPSIYVGAILVMLALSLTVTFVYLKIRIGNYAVVNFRRNLR